MREKVYGAWFGVTDLLRNWRYALPLVINLTGSVWFFLLIGKAGEFIFFFGVFFSWVGGGRWACEGRIRVGKEMC